MSWKISKDFSFCYGHRVYNQTLNTEYSVDGSCKCRHLHGHEGLIRITLSSVGLKNGMVTDFKHLNWFKKWLDETLDHKFIIGMKDPLLTHEVPIISGKTLLEQETGHYILDPTSYQDLEPALKEKYEGIVFVDFVPTSENLSKWIFDIVKEKMLKLFVKVESVQFYETPKSQSTYTD